MTSIIELGSFERVKIKDAWPFEDGNFTPWLADNLKPLGDALGIELEKEAVEHPVGPFRADILALAIGESGHRVVIENQFNQSDHDHLGKLLTYLAGIDDAKTVIWIAETIRPDHRAAIDWLNENTAEEFSFFAVEVELWRIGTSQPAPRFNVIASPNDWTRDAKSRTRALTETPLNDLQKLYLDYWTALREVYNQENPGVTAPKGLPQTWWQTGLGRTGFQLNSVVRREQNRILVEIYILLKGNASKAAFRSLQNEQVQIEKELGYSVSWELLPSNQGSRIAVYKDSADITNRLDWENQHSWLVARMSDFKKAFSQRIRSLSVNTQLNDSMVSQAMDNA